MKGCLLCTDLISLDVVFEDDLVAVVLHEDWAVRGHTMVVCKRHVENIADLYADEAAHFAASYRIVERAVLDETGAERAIIMKLGIAVPHLHVHIYPVSAAHTRADVMEMIDSRRRDPYDAGFVSSLRARLDRVLSAE